MVTDANVLAVMAITTNRASGAMPPSIIASANTGSPASTRPANWTSRAASLLNKISALLRGEQNRYSMVRRWRSRATVPAAMAGPIASTAKTCKTAKAVKKPAVALAKAPLPANAVCRYATERAANSTPA